MNKDQVLEELVVVYPDHSIPGTLVTLSTAANANRLYDLDQVREPRLYRVAATIGSHVPLTGTRWDVLKVRSDASLSVRNPPLSLYLHKGGRNAAYLDLHADGDEERLSQVVAEMDSDAPLTPLVAARSLINEFLDVLVRSAWAPLQIVRLDLYIGREEEAVAHQIVEPFPVGLVLGPIGGFHLSPLFAQLEGLAREAINSSSPYYRFLCAYRLCEGLGALRQRLRKLAEQHGVSAALPKDTLVDPGMLRAMRIDELFQSSPRHLSELQSKLKLLRNRVAHFLLDGEGELPLHVSDGESQQTYSAAAATLLICSVEGLRTLDSYFRDHLRPLLSRGSVLPKIQQRDQFRLHARMKTSKEGPAPTS